MDSSEAHQAPQTPNTKSLSALLTREAPDPGPQLVWELGGLG